MGGFSYLPLKQDRPCTLVMIVIRGIPEFFTTVPQLPASRPPAVCSSHFSPLSKPAAALSFATHILTDCVRSYFAASLAELAWENGHRGEGSAAEQFTAHKGVTSRLVQEWQKQSHETQTGLGPSLHAIKQQRYVHTAAGAAQVLPCRSQGTSMSTIQPHDSITGVVLGTSYARRRP